MVTAGLAESNGSLRRVYDSRHPQAEKIEKVVVSGSRGLQKTELQDREPGSAPEPHARQSSTGYI